MRVSERKATEILQMIICLILKQQLSFANNLSNRKTFKCSNLCATNTILPVAADEFRFVSRKSTQIEHKLFTLLHITNIKVIKQF